jgi:signal transduction histidine kinase
VTINSERGTSASHRVPLSKVLRLFGLVLLAWGIVSQVESSPSVVHRAVAFTLLTVAGASWIVALIIRCDASRVAQIAVGVMVVTGGALAGFAALAIVFPAVAVLCAALRWRLVWTGTVAAVGWLATVIALEILSPSLGKMMGSLAAILAGALVGIARRQAVEQAELVAQSQIKEAQAEVQRERAKLLAERNHLAREVHDVLAHTLAALSLQLEAFATVIDSEPDTGPGVREQLERTRHLVHDGLDEARRAVRALRDDAGPLDVQLQNLASRQGATFVTSGPTQRLSPQVVVTLFRVTQEALTNVMKHATNAPTTVQLDYGVDRVAVEVTNANATHPSVLSSSGGGYGLQGLAERLDLLGGHLEAGPVEGGWRVIAAVPLSDPVVAR